MKFAVEKAVRLSGENRMGEHADFLVRHDVRGEPYREGISLYLERDGDEIAHVFLEDHETSALRNFLNRLREAFRAKIMDADPQESFQDRAKKWLIACFGKKISADRVERNHRFLEEALELVQANGCTAEEARQLVDYVYGRPPGARTQEIGGVMLTLAALCQATGDDMDACAELELARVWTKIDTIRAKQAAKPKYSSLPQHSPQPSSHQDAEKKAAWHEGFNAARKMVESVTSHAAWGPDATIDFAFQHGIQTVKDVFKRAEAVGAEQSPYDSAGSAPTTPRDAASPAAPAALPDSTL